MKKSISAKQQKSKRAYKSWLKSNLRVGAIIPAYNVQTTIRKVVTLTRKVVDKVIVINDGSMDDTRKILKDVNINDIVVDHSDNEGLGYSLRHGFAEALKEGFDIVITLDSDGQHDANDINRAVKKIIEDDADVVIGSRLIDRSQWSNFPIQRLVGNRVITFLTNLACRRKVTTDSQSGFRVLRKSVIKEMDLTSKKMSISSEIIAEIARLDCRVSEISIKATYDKEISNIKAISDILKILFLLLKKALTVKKKKKLRIKQAYFFDTNVQKENPDELENIKAS